MTLAIAGTVIEGRALSRVEEIIIHESEADKLETSASDHRWEAARLISEELASGKKQRQLAREIGKDHKHVAFMARCWQAWGPRSPSDRPKFNEVYHSPEVRNTSKGHKTEELHIPSIEDFAEAMAADNHLAEIVARSVDRAKNIRQEQIDNDPQHKKNEQIRRKQKTHDIYADIRKQVNQLISAYSPDDKAEAERVALALEQAAQLIRTRIIGME